MTTGRTPQTGEAFPLEILTVVQVDVFAVCQVATREEVNIDHKRDNKVRGCFPVGRTDCLPDWNLQHPSSRNRSEVKNDHEQNNKVRISLPVVRTNCVPC